MILTLVGLFVAQVITFGYEDSSLLAVCSLRHGIDAIKYSGRFFVLQYILGFISVILYLIISYGNKAVRLSSGHSDSDLINWITRKKSDREKWKNRTAASHFNSTHRTRTSLAYEREARRKIRERNRDVTLGKRLSQGCSIKNFFTSMKFVSQELSDSFLIEILWLAFGNLYGLLGIIRSRVMNAPEIVGSENQMGFGQIVPLLLTVLPLLAAAEAYHGKPVTRLYILEFTRPLSNLMISYRNPSFAAYIQFCSRTFAKAFRGDGWSIFPQIHGDCGV